VFFFFSNHPQARIEKIQLENFRGVTNGTIEFNCLKNPIEKDTSADILGLYGQNGSGKTTMLEALQVAKLLMMGRSIPAEQFSNLISQDAESARMKILFQFMNDDETTYHVEYAFSLAYKNIGDVIEETVSKLLENYKEHDQPDFVISDGKGEHLLVEFKSERNREAGGEITADYIYDYRSQGTIADYVRRYEYMMKYLAHNYDDVLSRNKQYVVYDEVLSLSGRFDGMDYRFGAIFDTRSEGVAFLPKAKHTEFFPRETSQVMKEMERIKKRLYQSSKSYVFSEEVSQLLLEQINSGCESPYSHLILNLRMHANSKIHVLDSIVLGSRHNRINLYTANRGVVGIRMDTSTALVDDEGYETLLQCIKGINVILEQLIPGLSLTAVRQVDIDERDSKVDEDYRNNKVAVYSVRDGARIPLAQESTGILKLISSLGMIAYAYSNSDVTVAIDEIDAGVYEYLLGELLLIFEEGGSGQLIFTCHNLRPMELINRKFVCFTTTNTENRYIKMKNVRKENNLRDLYLKEIVAGNQEEELYSSARHGKIAAALQKAGEILA